MASSAKKRSRGSKASSKRKRKHSGSEDEEPAFLSSKYAERPTSKIYNSRFQHKDPAELFRKDLISAMKLPDSEILNPDEYLLITDPWKSEWEKGVQVPVNPDALPEPTVTILRKKSREYTFRLPKKLIRFTRNSFFNPEFHVMSYTNTLAERTCRYDMDDVDMQWLTLVNEDREDFGLQPLEENVFEQIIEAFEVQAYTNFQEAIKSEEGLGVEYDDDAICDVCRSPDSVEGNEMVFCDSCNICVHQICYGITKIPEGSWLCRTCALGIRPACVLCPNRGGAMKTTRCGQSWAHVGCAVWIPEVSFLNFVKMEPITKISLIPASRWALLCSICKEKIGACIQCSEKNCKVAFHVTCAFQEGLQMRASVKLTNTDDDKLQAFCQKHSKKLRGFFSDSSEDENSFAINKKETLTSEERANIRQQKIEAKEAEFYNYVNVDDVAELFEIDKIDIQIMYNYWKLKRRANWNRALLPPKVDNESTTEEENSPFSFLKKMVHQRQDLERVRNLCYMAMKREKFSLQWISQKQRIFEKQVEILSNKSTELNEEEMAAVLKANDGDMAFDKKYTGLRGPSPNVISVLTVLRGEDYLKTHFNGAVKGSRKSDRVKSERTPNPYAKHYLNGLAVRSQRYLNKPKKVSNLQTSLDGKANFSFSSQNSTDHFTSCDGCDSSMDLNETKLDPKFISQSDSKFDCFVANDNAIGNSESYHSNDVNLKQEDCNSGECKTEICFSEIPTFSQSSNDSTFDPSVNISTLSLDELVPELEFKNEIVPDDCVSNIYQSKSCNGLENETQDFTNIKKELSPEKQIPNSKISFSSNECVDDKSNSITFNSEDISNISNLEQINDFENIKFNLELPDENCVDIIRMDTVSPVEVVENSNENEKVISDVKTKVNKFIDIHNDDKLNSPVHCVLIKTEFPLTNSKIENTPKKVKNLKLPESCDKLEKSENSESCEILESNKTITVKSPTNIVVKEKDIKSRQSSNKSSPLRTQSPTYKSTENGIIKGNKSKQNFKKLQELVKSKSKNLTNSHFASSLVNKSHSSSINKCQEKSSSTLCKTDESDLPEVKESEKPVAAPVSRKDMLRGYKIPKKPRTEKPEENSLDLKRGNTPLSPLPDFTSTGLSGYQTKGPSWRKLEPRTKDISSCKSRTNVNINGSIQSQSSERLVLKLKKDTSDPESQRWKADQNNFNRNTNNWIGALPPPPPPPPQLLHSHPPPPPLPPRFLPHHPPRPWHRMRSRGGFHQIHMGYGNGPYS